MTAQRRVSWGHWGITYINEAGEPAYWLAFPCGPQGPIDSGHPIRARLVDTIGPWIDHAVAPTDAQYVRNA